MVKLQALRSILLVFFSIGFSFNIGNTVHEFGHAIADRLSGVPVSDINMIIHPFFAPHMSISGGIPDSMMGWPDAAGPMANVVLGSVIFAVLWKKRNPYLLPLLLWAPLACVQEGIGQVLTISSPGSDAARMVAAGFPEVILILICGVLLVTGILLFGLTFPVGGITPDTAWIRRFGLLTAGMLPYGILTMVICMIVGTQDDVSRSYNIIGGFVLIAVIMAALSIPLRVLIHRWNIRSDFNIRWSHGFSAAGLMIAVLVLELMFLNG